MWTNARGSSKGLLPGRNTFGPLFLILATPITAVLITHVFVNHDGSVPSFINAHESLKEIWPNMFDPVVWKMIGAFMGTQLVLMRVVPGKTIHGPITRTGHVPTYTANGFQCFSLTIALFLAGIKAGLYNGGIVYDHLPELISSLNVFSFAFCFLLYIKGALGWYSSSDHGSSGNVLFDFYWGIELYPRIFGWDVKQFTNCRSGLMFWGVAVLSYAFKQYEMLGYVSDSMLVSVALQFIFVAKFFWWEAGYMGTLDIMHDRAGYYLCWGCMVWVPSIYTSPAMFLVKRPIHLGTPLAAGLIATGLLLIYINYAADRQRIRVRATNGKCEIWGKPAEYIVGHYTTDSGEKKQSLLLTSGWWGVARHFHYVPEILGSLVWTLPVGFTPAPYFYVAYLTMLLVDRAFRDDARCASKYQEDWITYRAHVPALILPKLL